ncbi:hypothetical protein [Leptolyngbya sp. O-77]|uniref:hypothetical protein n=1 Tax=Leptolyngbya sp. O-77 TaxID=1080068 RepID=UPI0012E3CD3F|nr:hypothetical protein [Leptolyngbya sp. O-77]
MPISLKKLRQQEFTSALLLKTLPHRCAAIDEKVDSGGLFGEWKTGAALDFGFWVLDFGFWVCKHSDRVKG